MSPRLRRLLFLALLIIIGAGLGWYWSRPTPIPVQVQTVQRGHVEASVANTRAGEVKACRRAELSPAIGGTIAELPIHEGERVETGQVLLTLWNHDLKSQLTVAQREAVAAEASASQACVMAEVARREAGRLRRLHQQNLASEEAMEKAMGDAQAKQAGCSAARESQHVAEARVAVAKANLDRTILRAPFAGIVAKINGELYEYLTPSPPGIATPPAVDLIDNACLYISAPIDEVDAPKVQVGQTARISLDALPGERFPGRVRRIAPYVLAVEKQARTVDVEADFSNPADYRRLLTGYSADLEIVLETRDDVLRVPTDALIEDKRVLVYDPATQTLESREVQTGLSNWELTEITRGLREGEQIVTTIDRKGVEAGAYVTLEPAKP